MGSPRRVEVKQYSAVVVIDALTMVYSEDTYTNERTVKDSAAQDVLNVKLSADTLEKLQAKIKAHVELAEG